MKDTLAESETKEGDETKEIPVTSKAEYDHSTADTSNVAVSDTSVESNISENKETPKEPDPELQSAAAAAVEEPGASEVKDEPGDSGTELEPTPATYICAVHRRLVQVQPEVRLAFTLCRQKLREWLVP